MQTIIEYLTYTPWWVYLIFALCIYMGLKGLKDRRVNIRRVLILPILFLYSECHSLSVSPLGMHLKVGVFIVAILIGIGLGYLLAKAQKPEKVEGSPGVLHLKGSWFVFITIVLIFVIKYTQGVLNADHSAYLAHPFSGSLILGVSSILTGLFVGRVVFYAKVLLNK